MSDRIDMIHPELPDQVIHPRASKANAYLAGGWEIKPDSPAEEPPAADDAEQPDSSPSAKPDTRNRRTTATEKKEAS